MKTPHDSLNPGRFRLVPGILLGRLLRQIINDGRQDHLTRRMRDNARKVN